MAKKAAAKAKKMTKKKSAKPVRPAARSKKAKSGKPAKAKASVTKAKSKKPATHMSVGAKKKVAPKKPIADKGKKIAVKKAIVKPAKPSKAKAVPVPPKKVPAPPVVKKGVEKATVVKTTQKPLPTSPKNTAMAVQHAAPKATATALREEVKPQAPAPPRPVAVKKRPLKEKFQMEFQVRSTPSALYDMLLSPSGFSEWYCDDVDVRGEEYTFKWGNEEEKAMIIGQRQNEVTRFHRVGDEDEESYFEFRIKIDPITDEVALIVTDHCWPDETENSKALWASQIANLVRVLGA